MITRAAPQAAIALASHLGAAVYATAGSEEKRVTLAAKPGVRGVFNSRSLQWAEDLCAATEGRGVTMVRTARHRHAAGAGGRGRHWSAAGGSGRHRRPL